MRRPLVFLVRAPWWALIVGVALVAAAAALLDTQPRAVTTDVELRWQLELVVTQLEGCQTCHEPRRSDQSSPAAVVAARADHTPIALPTERPATAPSAAAQLDARLADAGRRLLDLPSSHDAAYQAAIEQILVLTAIRADVIGWTSKLAEVAALEAAVRALEHQAHPIRLRTSTTNQEDPHQLILPGSGLVAAPPSLVSAPVATAQAPRAVAMAALVSVPALAVLLVKRRGPPSPAASVAHLSERGSPAP